MQSVIRTKKIFYLTHPSDNLKKSILKIWNKILIETIINVFYFFCTPMDIIVVKLLFINSFLIFYPKRTRNDIPR